VTVGETATSKPVASSRTARSASYLHTGELLRIATPPDFGPALTLSLHHLQMHGKPVAEAIVGLPRRVEALIQPSVDAALSLIET
jgi:hypothetical protein